MKRQHISSVLRKRVNPCLVLQLFLLAKEVKMIQPPHPIDSTLAAVGNTPLVKLQKVVPAD
jgi:hypothetical protein